MRLIIHAPGIHVGGGGVLFRELVKRVQLTNFLVFVDERAEGFLPEKIKKYTIQSSVVGRLKAEYCLWKYSKHSDVVLCFHGMPPLFPVRGKVVVFLQNRNYLGVTPLSLFSTRTKIRLMIERTIFRLFKGNVNEYIVQTPTMKSLLCSWYKGSPIVNIIPFMVLMNIEDNVPMRIKKYDFIYVSDGEGHKNHLNLLEAWQLLASEGLYPTLVLTLPERNQTLLDKIDSCVAQYGIKINNFGNLNQPAVFELMRLSKALVFPSLGESFGLPLLEAKALGVPIIASELDYVRDVCEPVETFDPKSAVSIARAVKRFMGVQEEPLDIQSAVEFISKITT